jgi:membrane protease subunit (stomatin/prohibitin family)
MMGARIMQPLADYFAEAGYSYTQIDLQREELAQGIHTKLKEDFSRLGFAITDFRIEGTSFDEDTMRRINKIADTKAEALAAAAAGIDYVQHQQLEAMRDAAKNERGIAGDGVGIGAGVALGQSMSDMMRKPDKPVTADKATNSPVDRLKTLNQMRDSGYITEDEFRAQKQRILDSI